MDPLPENPFPDLAALAQTLKTKQAPLATGIAELLAGQQSIFNTLVGMQKQLVQVDRRSACTINQTRGSGIGKPYDEVRFPDNTLPSQPGQGRAPLPMLNNMLDIRALSGEDVTNYLTNHGILPENIPYNVTDRRKKLAEIIGCDMLTTCACNLNIYLSTPTQWGRRSDEGNGKVKNSKLKCDEDDDSQVDAVGGIDEEAKGPEWEIVQEDRDVDVDLDIAPPPPTPVPRPSSVALELPVPPPP
ncbi:hypothetical protein C8R41DRAFT_984157 [Lentinula lateritia]|uniref:Mug135-like C-terminal domain-containing protein n=1 Tax=Lentinula lateritia TaxID=40482 RepID=A0ABQ8V554_9AGAR|nr:hypothetical protein C8R41DRAFT_984157 [Lentinula lateritia]